MIFKNISWATCIGIYANGAGYITGIHAGIVTRITEFASTNLILTDCFTHRE